MRRERILWMLLVVSVFVLGARMPSIVPQIYDWDSRVQPVPEIHVFQHVQRLEHDRALHPVGQFEHIDALVAGRDRFLDVDLPFIQVFHRDQSAVFL